MKKLLIVLLALTVFCSSAFAADLDWANMTDDEITAIIAAGQAELASRNPAPADGVLHMTEGTVLVEQGGIFGHAYRQNRNHGHHYGAGSHH